jgi:DNA-3-methyladenine glycosylase I
MDARRGAEAGPDGVLRCPWALSPADYLAYHDQEWGVPVHGDLPLFERLVLEGFQAGLSWLTILRKREAFRVAFAGFDPATVGAFTRADVDRLLTDGGIVRHRRKIEAAVANAQALLSLQAREGEGALDRLMWSHAGDDAAPAPVVVGEVPSRTAQSTALAAALRREGFVFVGPTTVYAAMQACGIVDDHLEACAFGRSRAPGRSRSAGLG